MSVYSGFATRNQEQKYNSLIEILLIALKKRLIKFYNKSQSDEEKFKLLIKKVYKKMFILEKGKYMPPKFTSCFTDLIDTLKIDINYDTMSECSSIQSQQLTFRKKSIDFQPEELISNHAFKLKVNELQQQSLNKRQLSALSAPKRIQKIKQQIQNEQDQEVKKIEKHKRMTLSFVDQKEGSPLRKQKSKMVELIDIKDLRGTCHMPHLEDFIPKRSEIIPQIANTNRSQSQLIAFKPDKKQLANIQNIRRQKYVRANSKLEDI